MVAHGIGVREGRHGRQTGESLLPSARGIPRGAMCDDAPGSPPSCKLTNTHAHAHTHTHTHVHMVKQFFLKQKVFLRRPHMLNPKMSLAILAKRQAICIV